MRTSWEKAGGKGKRKHTHTHTTHTSHLNNLSCQFPVKFCQFLCNWNFLCTFTIPSRDSCAPIQVYKEHCWAPTMTATTIVGSSHPLKCLLSSFKPASLNTAKPTYIYKATNIHIYNCIYCVSSKFNQTLFATIHKTFHPAKIRAYLVLCRHVIIQNTILHNKLCCSCTNQPTAPLAMICAVQHWTMWCSSTYW